ncbi:MAG: hypothetical protein AUI36_32475 [Cyanobacteria bacterium 13_1_40CM_2_61_4]|nr:MAG: hypothetical protein AUI36_32475 [Cyanobacteria bacterium 13_1_40CM_2_61_4]
MKTHRFDLKLKISRVAARTAQGKESEVLQDTWTDADLLASKKPVTRCKMYRSCLTRREILLFAASNRAFNREHVRRVGDNLSISDSRNGPVLTNRR